MYNSIPENLHESSDDDEPSKDHCSESKKFSWEHESRQSGQSHVPDKGPPPEFPDFGKEIDNANLARFTTFQEIKDPPKFRAEAYATWLKELELWGEIHDDHPKQALVAAMAQSATGNLLILIEF